MKKKKKKTPVWKTQVRPRFRHENELFLKYQSSLVVIFARYTAFRRIERERLKNRAARCVHADGNFANSIPVPKFRTRTMCNVRESSLGYVKRYDRRENSRISRITGTIGYSNYLALSLPRDDVAPVILRDSASRENTFARISRRASIGVPWLSTVTDAVRLSCPLWETRW